MTTCVRGCCEGPDARSAQRQHYGSLIIGGSPSAQNMSNRVEEADLSAYRRLRKEGLQPKSHVGAAALEKAAFVPAEIETGHLTRNKKLAHQLQAATDIANNPETFTPLVAS